MAKKKKTSTPATNNRGKEQSNGGNNAVSTSIVVQEQPQNAVMEVVPLATATPAVGVNQFGEELVNVPAHLSHGAAEPVTRVELAALEELHDTVVGANRSSPNGTVPTPVVNPEPSNGGDEEPAPVPEGEAEDSNNVSFA